jgi:hypothetical protein
MGALGSEETKRIQKLLIETGRIWSDEWAQAMGPWIEDFYMSLRSLDHQAPRRKFMWQPCMQLRDSETTVAFETVNRKVDVNNL